MSTLLDITRPLLVSLPSTLFAHRAFPSAGKSTLASSCACPIRFPPLSSLRGEPFLTGQTRA